MTQKLGRRQGHSQFKMRETVICFLSDGKGLMGSTLDDIGERRLNHYSKVLNDNPKNVAQVTRRAFDRSRVHLWKGQGGRGESTGGGESIKVAGTPLVA